MDTIIFPPILDWDWMTQRPQQLMKQFARQGCRVFYCNHTQRNGKPVEELEPRLYLIHDHEHWVNHELETIRKASARILVWCSLPRLADRITVYRADSIIYDCVDDFPQWYPDEGAIVKQAHYIVCSSQRLCDRINRLYPNRRTILIRNGYDEDMGLHRPPPAESQRPPDLPPAGCPVIGYIGAWAPWIDEALIAGIAQSDSRWHVVVIGVELERKFTLQHLPNVSYLGLKPHRELPGYIRNFDIGVIPFRLNPVTLAANPIKAYEYLAAGKPVVATNMPECWLMEGQIDVGESRSAIIRLVQERIGDSGNAEARMNYALKNTWRERASECITMLKAQPQ